MERVPRCTSAPCSMDATATSHASTARLGAPVNTASSRRRTTRRRTNRREAARVARAAAVSGRAAGPGPSARLRACRDGYRRPARGSARRARPSERRERCARAVDPQNEQLGRALHPRDVDRGRRGQRVRRRTALSRRGRHAPRHPSERRRSVAPSGREEFSVVRRWRARRRRDARLPRVVSRRGRVRHERDVQPHERRACRLDPVRDTNPSTAVDGFVVGSGHAGQRVPTTASVVGGARVDPLVARTGWIQKVRGAARAGCPKRVRATVAASSSTRDPGAHLLLLAATQPRACCRRRADRSCAGTG